MLLVSVQSTRSSAPTLEQSRAWPPPGDSLCAALHLLLLCRAFPEELPLGSATSTWVLPAPADEALGSVAEDPALLLQQVLVCRASTRPMDLLCCSIPCLATRSPQQQPCPAERAEVPVRYLQAWCCPSTPHQSSPICYLLSQVCGVSRATAELTGTRALCSQETRGKRFKYSKVPTPAIRTSVI